MQHLTAQRGCRWAPQCAPFQQAAPQSGRVLERRKVTVCGSNAAHSDTAPRRRAVLQGLGAGAALVLAPPMRPRPASAASDFVQTPSGLLIQDITVGEGRAPQPGDVCVLHWAGYTKNYQAKRIDNTSIRDEPYEFVLGAKEAIPAFEEAVASMRVGGVRRIEVLGEIPELSYPRDRAVRFVNGFKYRYGPQPAELGGQRALDFVLDNGTLSPTNRTLLFDLKLLAVRSRQ